jgi:exodeoxyribonuclease VII small subunit
MTDQKLDGPIEKLSFEEALAALESIALYERGDALKKHCEAKLGEAELKVEKIVASGEGTAPFTTE